MAIDVLDPLLPREECTVIFNSISHSQSDRLERLQRYYLLFMQKVLHNDHRNMSYSELCHLFKLPTLTQRRTVTDCLNFYTDLSTANSMYLTLFSFMFQNVAQDQLPNTLCMFHGLGWRLLNRAFFQGFQIPTTDSMKHVMCLEHHP